jgi:hypothetical protein
MSKEEYKLDVTIYLRGDDLDPSSVSTSLGISPSKSQYKGEKRVTSTNREFVTKIGVWALAAETKSSSLSVHIDELRSKIGGKGPLINIVGVQEAYLDVFMSKTSDDTGSGTCEFQLSSESIKALESLGLPVQFTVDFVRE